MDHGRHPRFTKDSPVILHNHGPWAPSAFHERLGAPVELHKHGPGAPPTFHERLGAPVDLQKQGPILKIMQQKTICNTIWKFRNPAAIQRLQVSSSYILRMLVFLPGRCKAFKLYYLRIRHVILPIIIGFPIFPESDFRFFDPREKSISGEKCVGRYSRLT